MEHKILDRIKLVQGDITRLDTDAIVNAANNSLLGGGGVDGAIHKAAGHELLEYCKGIGGCKTGEAVITMGYNLPATYIVHTVGPVYSGTEQDKLLLASCYKNSLQVAIDHDVTSIAFPAISCGVYGYPITEACCIAMDSVCDFLRHNSKLKKVVFVLFSNEDYQVYQANLNRLYNK
jgi:O-acetyl-ADP-ribose deacetylase (regulator of RNase III)